MEITATHDDGTTTDITAAVQAVYGITREYLRWDRDLESRDLEQLATLARACGFQGADDAAASAAILRRQEDEERAERAAWLRRQAEQVVAALNEMS